MSRGSFHNWLIESDWEVQKNQYRVNKFNYENENQLYKEYCQKIDVNILKFSGLLIPKNIEWTIVLDWTWLHFDKYEN